MPDSETTPLNRSASDIKNQTSSNLTSGSPASAWDYFELTRLHKFPTGTMVVFWPCAFGLVLSAFVNPISLVELAKLTFLFFIGSTLVHSAACVINDICDRDFDRQVERTKNRPLARGAIGFTGANILLLSLLIPSIVLMVYAGPLAFYVGLFGIFPLHGLYPLMKRWTWWPQAWLGLAMNWGFPVAWITVTGYVDWKVVPVSLFGLWSWTLVYDTIYGCQDKKDDVKAGVKSTSLLFGSYVRPILSVFAAFVVGSFLYVGIHNGHGLAYFIISVGGTAAHFAWQLGTLDVDDPTDCWKKFNSNGSLGCIMWAGMMLDYYLEIVNEA
ncbi:UbiA prenyltransferase [Dendrothele bispora CBS 962.96]|uniref:4-hydroxybenzoate polyprenyltransferase, mitochondrial n=1 Tax=Dendrothele bispora (strain CBS 962.96) TaxID=1314807 RepID=A0A4S8MLK3_DENBC|nr:UbiA prenyltransferase [Dendrothele bispora CBS 962.96]